MLLYLGFLNIPSHSSASAAFLRAHKYLQQVELCELAGGGEAKKKRQKKPGKQVLCVFENSPTPGILWELN